MSIGQCMTSSSNTLSGNNHASILLDEHFYGDCLKVQARSIQLFLDDVVISCVFQHDLSQKASGINTLDGDINDNVDRNR